MSDILIIGGGVVGVTAAYFLAEAGVNVTLVEKGEIAAGSSYGNAGLICPGYSDPVPMPGVLTQGMKWMLDAESPFYIKPRLSPDLAAWLWRFQQYCNEKALHRAVPLLRDMQRASLAIYQQLVSGEKLDCDFERKGGISLYRTEKGLEKGRHMVEEMSQFGLTLELLPTAEAVRAVEPLVHPSVIGGVLSPEDAHVNPARFVNAMVAAARARGARILTHAEVMGFDTGSAGITAVRTTSGKFTPKQVVLAAGAWSTPVAKGLGVNIPMEPAKGYSVTIKRPFPTYLSRHLHLAEAKVAVTPMGSLLRFAGTLELAGFDFSINQRRVDAIVRAADSYLTGLDNKETVEVWRGMRPCSPDGLPYIGRTNTYRNLVVATGHAMLGVSMGPVTGKLVAQVVQEERPLLDITAFAPERFR